MEIDINKLHAAIEKTSPILASIPLPLRVNVFPGAAYVTEKQIIDEVIKGLEELESGLIKRVATIDSDITIKLTVEEFLKS